MKIQLRLRLLPQTKSCSSSFYAEYGWIKLVDDKVEALEFRVRDNCRFIDVPIKDLNIRKGIIIVYVSHKGVSKVATGDTRIQLSDTVIIISKVAGLRNINDLLS